MSNILNDLLFQAFAEASEYVYIFATDMQTGLSRWSRSAIDFFGMPGEYMEDALSIWLEHVHPDDLQMYLSDIELVFSGASTVHSIQYRAKTRYGDYVWVECRGSVQSDDEGNKVFAGMITRLDCQSIYDPLTGLKTKNQFYAMDFENKKGIIAILGIDFFKKIISTYGYDNGDKILIQLGKVFLELVGTANTVFRFAGDEFIFVLPEGTKEQMRTLYDRISEKAGKLLLGNGQRVTLSFSAAAMEYPISEDSRDDLIYKLVLSLDKVKRQNRGNLSFYTKEVFDLQKRNQKLKQELKRSIANNFRGFELFYQPWMNKDGTKIVGCEALLRWKGETITDSYPGEFIPILEETDDILEVGRFVMREAMRQQKLWEERYGNFIVSFNVSYGQFLEDHYVEEVEKAVKEFGVDPHNIVIELTESCSVQSPATLANVFAELKDLGFNIALDDFGTGYSSLEMLKLLPADSIKIEHTFVRELSAEGHDVDFAIIKSILYLCSELGQSVVVEGVENAEVESIIRQMNVGFLQGYYYSKPVCRADFEKLVDGYLERETVQAE